MNMDDLPYMGSFHGAEVPFVFGYPAELSSAGERWLSKTMGCYWVNFASTGDPNFGPASKSAFQTASFIHVHSGWWYMT